MRYTLKSLLVAVLLLAVSLAQAAPAAAQDADPGTTDAAAADPEPLSPDLKGAVGLGLIGAELGAVVPALLGARDWWAYVVFPVLGAAGGALGGHFLIDEGADSPELSVATLTAGMALFIPAMIVTLSATAYEPERSAPVMARVPAGLVQVDGKRLSLAMPAVGVVPGASRRESLRTGASTASALRVSLLSGQF